MDDTFGMSIIEQEIPALEEKIKPIGTSYTMFKYKGCARNDLIAYGESKYDNMLRDVNTTVKFINERKLKQLYINEYYHPVVNVYDITELANFVEKSNIEVLRIKVCQNQHLHLKT